MTSEERFIKNMVSFADLLNLLAEECAELAQAALKTRRAMEGTNPTPVTFDEALDHMVEEMQDVRFVTELVIDDMGHDTTESRMDEIRRQKTARWVKRLKEVHK